MGRLFGTDGVRGMANRELTGEIAYKLGRAGAYILTKEKKHVPRIIVATDTRVSCDMLGSALVAGICSVGATAVTIGVMPSPAVSALVRNNEFDAGVVISASHNPFGDNGIKFFDNDGRKLKDELEDEIEAVMDDPDLPSPCEESIGRIEVYDAIDDYVAFLKTTTAERFDGMRVCLDCANGASYKVAPITFFDLGCTVQVIHNEPDGYNINNSCGSTHPESLIQFVKDEGADVGFAFDGDADRVFAVDELGNIVDGDKILAICGKFMKEQGILKHNTVVSTVMSNSGFHICAEQNGLNIKSTAVGDRYVLDEMLNNGYNLGGEQSGHVIFLDDSTTGDGVLTAIKILTVMKVTGKKLSELASIIDILPHVHVNVRVSNDKKYKFNDYDEIKSAIAALDKKYDGSGRILIRTSGTEPLVRILIEGKDTEEMKKDAHKLAEVIEQYLI